MRMLGGMRAGTTALGLFLSLWWSAVSAPCQQGLQGWHQFISVEAGYVAHYPPTWYLLPPARPTLDIANFPPSRMVHAVVLPEGGGGYKRPACA